MFFYASKLLYMIVMPSFLTAAVLVAGGAMVLLRWGEPAGRRLLALGLAMIVVLGMSPVSFWMLLPLEERFPRGVLPEQPAGIIVLGGFEDIDISLGREALAINDNAERLTEGLVLARRYERAKLIFTGGDASLVQQNSSAAGAVGDFYRDAGIEKARIVLEGRSRTTFENAVFLHEMLKPGASDRYILVTSAFHLPRSMGTFRKQGFDVVAWPVDYRTEGWIDALQFTPKFTNGLSRLDFVLKEWIGLVAYRLTGRTDALWPGPKRP